MTKCKVRKEKDRLIIELPLDIIPKGGETADDWVDVFPLKDGFFLIGRLPSAEPKSAEKKVPSAGLPAAEKKAPPTEKKGGLSDEELGVLRKLDSFRFSQRMPGSVNAVLSPKEKRTLDGLIQKRFVTIYYGGKYSKTGVYNIPKNIYPLLKKSRKESRKERADPSSVEHMERYGYMVVENERDAKRIGAMLEERIKDGRVIGVRAFDRKFYLATKQFFSANEKRVREELGKSEKSAGEISSSLKMDENACMTLLAILCDAGDAIEKKKGVFAII